MAHKTANKRPSNRPAKSAIVKPVPTSPQPEESNENKLSAPLPVVGIGASAGGLEAFTALLRNLSGDTGLAFVIIQHLDPKHSSILVELLAKVTTMSVEEAKDDTKVEPNRVYVTPPNSD